MTKQVQRRRGTSTQHTSFTGAEGEISVNTTNKSIHVHDGLTAGGVEAARADLTNVSDANLNAALSGNTLSSLTITSVDINGGTIDGAVIGGSSAAAGTFTTVTASGDVTIADKIVHSGDTNTAIRFPAADTVTVETSGTERLRVDSSGNVGIGTSSPAYALDVQAATDPSIRVRSTGTASTDDSLLRIQIGGTTADSFVYFGDSADADAGYIQYGHTSDFLAVGVNAAERMRIDSAGNVGIGTSSPSVRLDVRDSIASVSGAADSIAYFGNEDTTSTATTRITLRSHQGDTFRERVYLETGLEGVSGGYFSIWTRPTGSGITEKVRVTAAGNVGIGTASPASIVGGIDTSPVLSIGGSDATLTTGDKAGSLSFITNDTSYTGTYADGVTAEIASVATTASGAAYGLAFYTGHVGNSRGERMRITSTGLGIGTTIPSEELHIRAAVPTFRLEDSDTSAYTNLVFNTGSFAIDIDPTGAGSSSVFTVDIDASERMRIDASGNVGIGTSSPAARLHVTSAQDTAAEVRVQAGGTTTATALDATLRLIARSTNGGTADAYVKAIGTGGESSFLTFGTESATVLAERMRIDSAGNVGIGTSSPVTVLDVSGTSPTLTLRDSRTSATWSSGVELGKLDFFTSDATGIGAHSVASIGVVAGGSNTASPDGVLVFSTGLYNVAAAERMRIDASGNVGIGTSSPAEKLHVVGAIIGQSNDNYFGNYSSGAYVDIGNLATSEMWLDTRSGTLTDVPLNFRTKGSGAIKFTIGSTERMRIDSAGNVGIGVAPSAWHSSAKAIEFAYPTYGMSAGGGAFMSFNAFQNSAGSWIYKSTDQASRFDCDTGGAFSWHTAGTSAGTVGNAITFTQAMTLDASGNLGIGTTSPSADLSVGSTTTSSGDVHLRTSKTTFELTPSNSDAGGMNINVGFVAGGQGPLKFSIGGTERVRIDANGIKFNGDTAAANALDDYEEGTWTPQVTYNGSDAGQTYTHQVGTYTKVGRVVHYQAYVQVATNSSATGSLAIGGLPFTSSTATNVVTTGSAGLDNAAANLDQPVGRVGTNTTQVQILAGNGTNNWSSLDNSVRGSNFRVYVAGHYITD